MTPDTMIERTDKAQFTRLDDDLLAIDADAGFCYSLNDTAGAMWTALDTPMSIEALCRSLGQTYAVDPATCRTDVIALVTELEQAGLLRVVPGPQAN